jgi:hypothetical protein
MENYNWIKVYYHDAIVEVRQVSKGSSTFVDGAGNEFDISELDFTRNTFEPQIIPVEKTEGLKWLLESNDANSIAGHKAKIDEREYWRKLRGDIALEIIRKRGGNEHYYMPSHFATIADATRVLFDEIYEQDQKFFENEYND